MLIKQVKRVTVECSGDEWVDVEGFSITAPAGEQRAALLFMHAASVKANSADPPRAKLRQVRDGVGIGAQWNTPTDGERGIVDHALIVTADTIRKGGAPVYGLQVKGYGYPVEIVGLVGVLWNR